MVAKIHLETILNSQRLVTEDPNPNLNLSWNLIVWLKLSDNTNFAFD